MSDIDAMLEKAAEAISDKFVISPGRLGSVSHLNPLQAREALLAVLREHLEPLLTAASVPMVFRPATGRTIPDLTKLAHICEYQGKIVPRNERAEAAESQLREARKQAELSEGFLEVERSNHKVSIMEWERTEKELEQARELLRRWRECYTSYGAADLHKMAILALEYDAALASSPAPTEAKK